MPNRARVPRLSSRRSAGRRVGSSRLRRRSGSFWRDSKGKPVSRRCAAGEGSSVICTIGGVRTSWRLGKNAFRGDTVREATSSEVIGLRQENEQLKQLVAELSLKYRLVKKSLTALE